MEFGQALTGLKHGSRATREGWNGKGMWVVMVGAGHYDVGARTVGLNVRKDPAPNLRPWLGLKAHNGDFVPWVASQSDILADDWVVLDAEDYVAKVDLRVPLNGVEQNLYALASEAGTVLEEADGIFSVEVVHLETTDGLVVKSNVVEMPNHRSETRMKSFADRLNGKQHVSIQVDTHKWGCMANRSTTDENPVELFAVIRIEYGQRNRRSE
jgi:hypothetical protein